MKILCVCQKGNSRSVALRYILIKKYNHDALAMGLRKNSKETKEILYKWADIIILTDRKYRQEIPIEYKNKLKIWDVGTDIWFTRFASDLINKFQNYINSDLEINNLA